VLCITREKERTRNGSRVKIAIDFSFFEATQTSKETLEKQQEKECNKKFYLHYMVHLPNENSMCDNLPPHLLLLLKTTST